MLFILMYLVDEVEMMETYEDDMSCNIKIK